MTLNIISNFAANIALRNLTINGDEATKSVGKLSSGSRVVTAADDAAALAIGTRLNTEVKSLEQASINAGQAVSLLQIADGGLSRLQEMLTRMKTLAVQSGSDNLSNTERALLDTEFQNLKLEVGRLTKDTKFNGISILGTEAAGVDANVNGGATTATGAVNIDQGGGAASWGEGGGQVIDFSLRGFDNRAVTIGGDGTAQWQLDQVSAVNSTIAGNAAATLGTDIIFRLAMRFGNLDGNTNSGLDAAGVAQFGGAVGDDVIVKYAVLDQALFQNNSGAINLNTGVTLAFGNENAAFAGQGGISKESAKNSSLVLSLDAGSDIDFLAADIDGLTGAVGAYNGTTGDSSGAVDFDFKVGTGIIPDEDEINIKIGGVTVEQLGITNADILTKSKADAASENLSFALDYLVNIRSDIGASINRLETAGDNIAISMENQEAARSRLLDLNVAAEITTFTSKQILLQSGISVLAQSNQLPQNLLRLFA